MAENNQNNDFLFTFSRLKDNLKDLSQKTQGKIESSKYLDKLADQVAENVSAVNNVSQEIETPSKFQKAPPFVKNFIKENPESVSTENPVNTSTKETKEEPPKEVKVVKLLSRDKMKGLDSLLKNRVFGQDEVIEGIVNTLKVSALNIKINKKKPAGNFFFAGPSGVGKTELAQALADALQVPLLKINMGEFGLEHEVSKLLGAPPGFAGHDQEGKLELVNQHGACVVLFDEFEKAHQSIDKILLSILDHGECQSNKNENISFTETIVIATSNLGAEVEYYADLSKEKKNELRMEYIKEGLRPEIINRYDSIFQFNALSIENYSKIIKDKFLKELTNSIKEEHEFELKFSDKLVEWMIEKSYDPAMGGRPARKFIEKIVIQPLADYMLDDNFDNYIKEHKEISLDLNKDGNIYFKGKNRKILGVLENTQDLVNQNELSKFSKNSTKPI